MPCLLLILSLYSIQNCYPLQTGTLQGFESSCPLLKKDFGKNYCPCPLLKKQLLQKYSSCLLLKKQIKNKYFSCLLFLTTTIYRHKPNTFREADDLIDRYIYFYNHERIQNRTGVLVCFILFFYNLTRNSAGQRACRSGRPQSGGGCPWTDL